MSKEEIRRRPINADLIGVANGARRLTTPALIIDRAAMKRNFAAMNERCARAGMRLRPHGKTHKCSSLAREQLAAGATGICAAAAARNVYSPKTRIVGVCSAQAPCFARSFEAGKAVEAPVSTVLGDGMACRKPDADAVAIILENVERIVEVTDAELADAMRRIFAMTHNVAEGAGAAAFAAAWRERESLQGKRVGLTLSGGNVDSQVFADVLAGKY